MGMPPVPSTDLSSEKKNPAKQKPVVVENVPVAILLRPGDGRRFFLPPLDYFFGMDGVDAGCALSTFGGVSASRTERSA